MMIRNFIFTALEKALASKATYVAFGVVIGVLLELAHDALIG